MIKQSEELRNFWGKYQSDNSFAKNIIYEDTTEAMDSYLKKLLKEELKERHMTKQRHHEIDR
ncbi:hypothetical protein [Enterococcus sp. DIV0187]|uniref:hypothetical protein n=1 Tax=Enterococcus sp. DIV0187 TaxID=2774644 RepID=UPI003F258943